MTSLSLEIPQEILDKQRMPIMQQLGYTFLAVALLVLFIGIGGVFSHYPLMYCLSTVGIGTLGGLLAVLPKFREGLPGIKHNGVMQSGAMRRGVAGWMAGVAFTLFYVLLYWYPEAIVHWVTAVDPLSMWLRGVPADRWFLYGTLYTLSVVIMGIRMFAKYRHSRYHLVRTMSVMAAQLFFAFLIPAMLVKTGNKEFYFSYFWPLKPEYLFPSNVLAMLKNPDALVQFMVFWTLIMTFLATPILTYFYGKRWYCSWICGCGGLAETLGDPYRQNSSKTLVSWQIERYTIYSVLAIIVTLTSMLWYDSATGGQLFGSFAGTLNQTYGFFIGAVFSGVVGVGFYPILGSRVWCRFGCPMAAVLGILQRWFSRFQITTNGGQCISCGNCSTYCEMGIDVRAYAQRGAHIKRASCVGCGVCAAVCPRGVLKLENT
jgi:ferredoxin-type protein NapH